MPTYWPGVVDQKHFEEADSVIFKADKQGKHLHLRDDLLLILLLSHYPLNKWVSGFLIISWNSGARYVICYYATS